MFLMPPSFPIIRLRENMGSSQASLSLSGTSSINFGAAPSATNLPFRFPHSWAPAGKDNPASNSPNAASEKMQFNLIDQTIEKVSKVGKSWRTDW